MWKRNYTVVETKMRLETSLASTNPPTASFVLGRPATVERRNPTIVSSATAVGGKRALGFGLCFVHSQGPTGQLLSVEGLDSLCGVVFAFELDESESAHTTGHLVEGHHHVLNRTDGAESLEQLFARQVETQITSKHFAWNDILLW